MKRSADVVLLVMGTVAVGAAAYSMMPSENCQPGQPGTTPQTTQCRTSSSSSSGGYRTGYYGGSSSSSSSYPSQRQAFAGGDTSSGSSAVHGGSAPIARGGFGSFSSHFTGGG
jgi:hypothetical protein